MKEETGRTPAQDGFFMPGEFERQEGCILIWPERPGSWPNGAKAARTAFFHVIRAIALSEEVYVAANETCIADARARLGALKHVHVFPAKTDDAWARDIAPTFLVNKAGEVRCVNWAFNAWGGSYNGLYASWEKDDAFAKCVADRFKIPLYDAAPFVLEGGAIHTDGQGTVLVTQSCLLSPGRNPSLEKAQIEEMLCAYLGAEKIIWLPDGIYGDETDGHVDNVCAFLRPGEVVLAFPDREDDPQYPISVSCRRVLEQERDAKGNRIVVHLLPTPDVPVTVTQKDLEGYVFEPGEEVRRAGERLAASYVNFYFSNDAVILPAFGGENEASDRRAREIMRRLCPERTVISVAARDILLGGGNIHCITQQIPQGASIGCGTEMGGQG